MAYRLFLQRPAENSEAVDVKLHITMKALMAEFIQGPEFAERFAATAEGKKALSLRPSKPLLSWAASRLPVEAKTRLAITQTFDWGDLWRTLALDHMVGPMIQARLPHHAEFHELSDSYDVKVASKDRCPLMPSQDKHHGVSTPAFRPYFSVLVPCFKSDPDHLREMIESVVNQTYTQWELILSDDGSENFSAIQAVVNRFSMHKRRIRLLYCKENNGISSATNRALALARGDYVAFLDHDDRLAPNALFTMANALQQNHRPTWLYSDEDRFTVDERGVETYHTPHLKASVDTEVLQQFNYICHLLVVQTDLCRSVGGLISEFDGAQDHDLVLRLLEATGPESCRHVSQILYHWRQHAKSLSTKPESKDLISERIVKLVTDHLHRSDEVPATVSRHHDLIDGPRNFVARVRRRSPPANQVALLVHGSGPDLKGVHSCPLQIRSSPSECLEDVLIFLNAAYSPVNQDWWEELAAQALRPKLGVVAGRLIGLDNDIEHAGSLLGWPGGPEIERYGPWPVAPLFRSRHNVIRSVSIVGPDLFAIKRELLFSLGGIGVAGDALATADLCLRATQRGLVNLYTPYATVRRRSPLRDHVPMTPLDVAAFHQRWRQARLPDPFYSPAFTRGAPPFSDISL